MLFLLQSFGSLEGQSLSELVKSARGRGVGVVEYTPPGGESLDEVEARTVEFFCDLCRYEVCEYMASV